MNDKEVWTSVDLLVKGQRRTERGLSLTRSAISWTARGEALSQPLDAITAIALQHAEDDGLSAMCHIALKDGAEVLVLNKGDGADTRIAYREFVATLIDF